MASSSSSSAVVHQRRGRWGLPSFHPDDLHVQLVLRMSGTPFNVALNDYGFSPAHGSLPSLQIGRRVVSSASECVAELRLKRSETVGVLDSWLSTQQRAELSVYETAITEKLFHSILYSWFCDEDNFNAHTKALIGGALPWPLDKLAPKYSARGVRQECASRKLTSDANCQATVAEVLVALSAKLADQSFLFGDRPCSLDALVCAHLLVVSKSPACKKVFGGVWNRHQFSTLRDYVQRVGEQFLGNDGPAASQEIRFADDDDEKAFEVSTRPTVSASEKDMQRKGLISVGVAVASVVAYIAYSLKGSVAIVYEDDEAEE